MPNRSLPTHMTSAPVEARRCGRRWGGQRESACTSSTEAIHSIRCTSKRPPRDRERSAAGRGQTIEFTYQELAPTRPRLRPIFAVAAKARRPCRAHFLARSSSARPAVMFASDDGFLTTILRLLQGLPAYHDIRRWQDEAPSRHMRMTLLRRLLRVLRQDKKPSPYLRTGEARASIHTEELLPDHCPHRGFAAGC